MTTEAPPLDPRIEEILRDIAADPNARLFTCDVEKLARGVGHARVDVSVSMAGLTNAERELLRVGREEVARLLLIAYRERLEAEDSPQFCYPHERMSREQWDARARRSLAEDAACADLPARTAHRVLRILTEPANQASQHPTSAELLSASLTLHDTPSARVYAVIDLALAARWRAAARRLESVLTMPMDSLVRIPALEWKGLCLAELAGPEHALVSQRETTLKALKRERTASLAVFSAFSALWLAAHHGMANTLQAASTLLADCPRTRSTEVDLLRRIHVANFTLRCARSREQTLSCRKQSDGISNFPREVLDAVLG